MSSLRLTTQLQQRMVLTPQLRQRIEMLQMTALELNELIEQELVANPILEEVLPGDEVQEISDGILDQNANGLDDGYTNGSIESHIQEAAEAGSEVSSYVAESPSENGTAESHTVDSDAAEDQVPEASDSFEEIDYGREFQDYLDPGYKTQEIEYKDDAPTFEQFLTRPPSLAEHLEWQLNMRSLDREVRDAATAVIGNMNADGRLS